MTSTENVPLEKNRSYFIQALFLLLDRKAYRDISVEDIAEKAGFSRRTFYRHFSKDALLDSALSDVVDRYSDRLALESDLSIRNIAGVFFEFWSQQLQLLKALDQCNLLFTLLGVMDRKIPEIYERIKPGMDEYGGKENRVYVLAFSIGGFWNALVHWLHTGSQAEPESFAAIIDHVAASISPSL